MDYVSIDLHRFGWNNPQLIVRFYSDVLNRRERREELNTENHSQTAAFLWSIADLLRGDFKQSQYGRIILPFTLLRRMECVLEPTKGQVLTQAQVHQDKPDMVREQLLLRAAGQQFYNASSLTLATLSDTQTADDLMSYVQSFSTDAREIFEHFRFEEFVGQLATSDLLYQVVQRFAGVDLSPERISNFGMGIVFEELIRKFAESSNETAGEHFTPRDIVHLTTSLVITAQDHKLQPHRIVTIYDPTAGTGGFLSEGDEYIQAISQQVTVSLHGQELNPESYAICKADMLIKGQTVSNIKLGNTLSDDQLAAQSFDFMLSNPPFGVEWKKVQKQVTDEHKGKGFDGRFGAGLPRVSDGSLLFLLHLVSKMRDPREGGSRIGIILNGSPLFTGGAGSGESEIRRYLLQNDLVEAIVALPTDMFYNTGIATYVWILSNHKPAERKGTVQLIDGTQHFSKMRKSLGSKRQYITDEQIDDLVRLYGRFEATPQSKIFSIDTFGYRRITIDRPLRDEQGNPVCATKGKNKGKIEADSSLRDYENVPLGESIYAYFDREVKPHVPDAWIDTSKCDELDGEVGIVGFEIPFNRHFYVFQPPRSLDEIDRDLQACTDRIKQMIEELSA